MIKARKSRSFAADNFGYCCSSLKKGGIDQLLSGIQRYKNSQFPRGAFRPQEKLYAVFSNDAFQLQPVIHHCFFQSDTGNAVHEVAQDIAILLLAAGKDALVKGNHTVLIEIVLSVKILVEAALGDPCGSHDTVDAGLVVGVFGKLSDSGGYDTVSRLIIVFVICEKSETATDSVQKEKTLLIDSLKDVLSNKPFVIMALICIIQGMALGMHNGSLVYYLTMVLQNIDVSSPLMVVIYAGTFIASVTGKFFAKFDKVLISKSSFLMMSAGVLLRVVTGDSSVAVMLIAELMVGLGGGMFTVYTITMLMDCAEYGYNKKHIRNDGLSDFSHPDIRCTAYGYGWFTEFVHGHCAVHHGGSVDGFKSRQLFLPEENFVVFILTNRSCTQACNAIGYALADAFAERRSTDWNTSYLRRSLLSSAWRRRRCASMRLRWQSPVRRRVRRPAR